MKRSLRSFVFWKGDFFQSLQPSPDLYGPFWIATTVVFILFVTGNISGSVMASINGVRTFLFFFFLFFFFIHFPHLFSLPLSFSTSPSSPLTLKC